VKYKFHAITVLTLRRRFSLNREEFRRVPMIPEVVQIITLFLTAISALGAVGAAIAAWFSAKATQSTEEAQMYIQFMNEYGSDEMRDNLRRLRNWYNEQGQEFAQKWLEALEKGDPKAQEVDRARRHVTFYFYKAVNLLDAGLVSKPVVRRIASVSGIDIWYTIVEPLDKALNPDYDKRSYETLRKICGRYITGQLLRPIPAGPKTTESKVESPQR
jgi:predicted PurR-regulated permease PerM